MSLFLFNAPCDFHRPSSIRDQHFGLHLKPEDLVAPLIQRELSPLLQLSSGYLRPWHTAAVQQDKTVSCDKDRFQASLDVQQFKPEEITVKVSESDNTVTVEGKHEEKEDEHGFISRHFVRKYVLPEGHDVSKVESKLSSDGVLTIIAPRFAAKKEEHRTIPIIQTGQPSKIVEDKQDDKKK